MGEARWRSHLPEASVLSRCSLQLQPSLLAPPCPAVAVPSLPGLLSPPGPRAVSPSPRSVQLKHASWFRPLILLLRDLRAHACCWKILGQPGKSLVWDTVQQEGALWLTGVLSTQH